jgi:hypothetical protein
MLDTQWFTTGLGSGALANNIDGNQNTAVGKLLCTNTQHLTILLLVQCFMKHHRCYNVALVLLADTTASNNTAVGVCFKQTPQV